MATETIKIAITDANYVPVTAGHFNVYIRQAAPVALRLHVGQTLPAPSTVNYVPISGNSVSLSDLEGADIVYLMAEAPGAEVVVVRGG